MYTHALEHLKEYRHDIGMEDEDIKHTDTCNFYANFGILNSSPSPGNRSELSILKQAIAQIALTLRATVRVDSDSAFPLG